MKVRIEIESFQSIFVTTFYSRQNLDARQRGILVSDLNYGLRSIGYDCMWWEGRLFYISDQHTILKEVYIDRNTLKSYMPNFNNPSGGALRRLQNCIGKDDMLRLISFFLENGARPNLQKILEHLGFKNEILKQKDVDGYSGEHFSPV